MQASRLLSILMLLQARGQATARALARSLEVSERTILRDIDQLSAAGIPLWSERGRQGGFRLRPAWTTQLTGMTEAESTALLLAGMPGPATELGLGEAAVSARLKLLASVPESLRAGAAVVAERLYIDPVDWYRGADTPVFLQQAAAAVWQTCRVRVEYGSWRGPSRRDLEPLGLVLKAGAWYMAARERKGRRHGPVRTYRLANVTALSVSDDTFRRPDGFDLGRYWRESTSRFEAELRPLAAKVLVSPRAWGWIRDARSRHEVLPQESVVALAPDGWHALAIHLESVDQGARQILGYGAEIQVLEPIALRDEVIRVASGILVRYA